MKKVCKYCGSEDVWLDAIAIWDSIESKWVLSSTQDYAHCEDCDGATIIIDKEI